jgi:hypothetical protein
MNTDRPKLSHHEILQVIRTTFDFHISRHLSSRACLTEAESQSLLDTSSVKIIQHTFKTFGATLERRIEDARMFGEEAVNEITEDQSIIEEVFGLVQKATDEATKAGTFNPNYNRRELGRERKKSSASSGDSWL